MVVFGMNVKDNIKSKLFIDSIVVNTASFVEKAGFFVANILIARYLSVDHFGEYSTALAYATFFSTMTDIGINVTLVRALNLEKRFENEHLTNALIIKSVLAVVMYVLMAVSLFFAKYNNDVIGLTLIFGLVRICNEFMLTFYSVDEAHQNFMYPSIMNSIYVVTFIVGIIIVITIKGNYYHLAYIRLGIVLLFILLLSHRMVRSFKFVFNWEVFRWFFFKAIPFSIVTVLWNLILKANVIIISLMVGTTEVGIFTNSMLFLDTLSIIPGNLRKITIPELYKALEKNDRNKFQFFFDVMSKYFGIISFCLMVLLFLFARDIIIIIFGEKYLSCVPILQLISFAIPLIFNIALTIIIGLDKRSALLRVLVVATIVNIVSNIILIHFFSLIGAAIVIAITYGLIFILGHLYLMLKEKIKMINVIVCYLKLIAIATTVIYMSSATGMMDYPLPINLIGVSVIYVILVMVFILKKDDIRIIREMIKI